MAVLSGNKLPGVKNIANIYISTWTFLDNPGHGCCTGGSVPCRFWLEVDRGLNSTVVEQSVKFHTYKTQVSMLRNISISQDARHVGYSTMPRDTPTVHAVLTNTPQVQNRKQHMVHPDTFGYLTLFAYLFNSKFGFYILGSVYITKRGILLGVFHRKVL